MNFENSVMCILMILIIGCNGTKNADQPGTSTENGTVTPLTSLLQDFKSVTLPYPNQVDTFKFKKFTEPNERHIRDMLSSCHLITIDLSSENVWDYADIAQDSASLIYLAGDTSACIVPGFTLFQNENFVVLSLHTGSEEQGIDTNYLLNDHEVVCVINREGKCINAITAGHHKGNIHGFVDRTFAFDKDQTLHIYEQGGITSDSSQYSLLWNYQILQDGRIAPIN